MGQKDALAKDELREGLDFLQAEYPNESRNDLRQLLETK
jgi:hypothetical protein